MAVWILELEIINACQKIDDMLNVTDQIVIDLDNLQSKLFGASLTVPNYLIGA